MHAWRPGFQDFRRGGNASNWQATRKTFANGDKIWVDAASLESEPMPCSSEPCPNFISYHGNVVLGRKASEAFQEFMRWFDNTANALYRLDNDSCRQILGCGKFIQANVQSFETSRSVNLQAKRWLLAWIRHELDELIERRKWTSKAFTVRHRKGTEGAAVITAFEGDEPLSARCELGRLDRSFDGFSAGIGKLEAIEPRWRDLREPLIQFRAGRRRQARAGVPDASGYNLFDSAPMGRMTMAEICGAGTANQVEIAITACREKPGTFSSNEDRRALSQTKRVCRPTFMKPSRR